MKAIKPIVILALVYVGIIVAFESMLGYFQPAGQGTLVITTMDADGTTNDRVLARLKSDGQLYVAANHWPRAWYRQALENPSVQVTVDGEKGAYVAIPVTDEEHDRVNRENGNGIVFRILTGFPPRYFVRLDPAGVFVERLLDAPIITPDLHPSIGENIQGPSVIRVPEWVQNPLGAYYLYFADHKGTYIRLAYADDLLGPWHIHPLGSLQIADSYFLTAPPEVAPERAAQLRAMPSNLGHDRFVEATTPHIASPDVHVDDENRRIVMYFHGLEGVSRQLSRVATSSDGIHFEARPEPLGRTYMRTLRHDRYTYAMPLPGQFYRSRDSLGGFEEGPRLFTPNMRHAAFLKRGETLFVFWTQVGHVPERILLSTVDISGDWATWSETPGVEVIRPEFEWEGADAPLERSVRSTAYGHVNQLRDPTIFDDTDSGRIYLLYAVAGESGIAIAEVHLDL